MRFTALGLAAVAIAVQTIRWIIAKTDIESEDGSVPPSPTKDQVILKLDLEFAIVPMAQGWTIAQQTPISSAERQR